MANTQMRLNFEEGISSKYASCREFTQVSIIRSGRQLKYVAADLGYSPSVLSRKLSQNEGDNSRFTLDDLEAYIACTGDTDPILYLVDKFYAQTSDAQIKRLEAELASLRAAAVSV